jgi:hypothetical protein
MQPDIPYHKGTHLSTSSNPHLLSWLFYYFKITAQNYMIFLGKLGPYTYFRSPCQGSSVKIVNINKAQNIGNLYATLF